jgi:recombination protein RecA
MPSPSLLRAQIEAALADRIPSALTPAPRTIRSVLATGISGIDALLQGGLPVGAITEMSGPECSGRTSIALSFIAGITRTAKVCAWVDVADTLHPESAAAAGVDLARLLWVRCGVKKTVPQSAQNRFALDKKYLIPPPAKKGLHGGGFGPHPRGETKGISDAISDLLRTETAVAARCAEPLPRVRRQKEVFKPLPLQPGKNTGRRTAPDPARDKPWSRIDQALRVTDLLLQAGGFSAIVLDMGSIAPEYASRVPLATWFRYRTAAERTQASILLLTQYPCARSSAGLVLRLQSCNALQDESTVFSGINYGIEIVRQRFTQDQTNVIPLRKSPHRETGANWISRTAWAGRR